MIIIITVLIHRFDQSHTVSHVSCNITMLTVVPTWPTVKLARDSWKEKRKDRKTKQGKETFKTKKQEATPQRKTA